MVSGFRVLMTGALAVLLGSVVTSLTANTTQAGTSVDAGGERPAEHRRGAHRRHAGRRAALPARRTPAPGLGRDVHPGDQRRLAVLPGPGDPAHRQAGAQPPDDRQRTRRRSAATRSSPRTTTSRTSCRVAGRRGLPDGLDRQVPERDPEQGPLQPARLELLRGAGPPGLRLRAQSLRDQRPVALGQRLPRELHPPPPPLEGARVVPRRPTVLRPLLGAGPAPVLAGYGRRPAGRPGEVPRHPRPPPRRPAVGARDRPQRQARLAPAVRRDARAARLSRGSWRSIASSPCSASTTRSHDLVATLRNGRSCDNTRSSCSPRTTATCCASTT